MENIVVTLIQDITIRRSNEDDFSALAGIHNEIYPDDTIKPSQLRDKNVELNPNCKFARWVAMDGNRIIGFIDYRQWASAYDPHHFHILVHVHPDYQQRGIGNMLYQTVLDDLVSFQPRKLTTHSRNDQLGALAFIERKGFVEYWRQIHWTLDVAQADVSAYESIESKLQEQGIVIKTLSELVDDPNRDRKLYDLYWQLVADEPVDEDLKPLSFEAWVNNHLNDENILPDHYFIAVYGEDYIGTTSNWKTAMPNILHTGMTGVRQAFTRRGIATALKVRGIKVAQRYGASALRPDNESNNQPILKLNEKLGFTREYEWTLYKKETTSNDEL